jgi:NADH:ubiquinone oxidoreductase subunit 4 (subunit M)
LHWTELAVLIPIIIAIFLIGIQPAPFFATMDASVGQLVDQVEPFVQQVQAATTTMGDVVTTIASVVP